MAQVDTGLGWSAKDAWLMQGSGIPNGLLGTLSSPVDWNTDIIPVFPATGIVPTYAEVAAGGMEISAKGIKYNAFLLNPSYNIKIVRYVRGSTSIWNTLVCQTQTTLTGSSSTYPNNGNLVSADRSDQRVTRSAESNRFGGWLQHQPSGLYYYEWSYTTLSNLEPGTVYYQDLDSAIAAMSSPTTYYKLNPGFAVCCMVKYVSLNGQTIATPVLISTIESAVDITTDGSTIVSGQYKSIQRYDGVSFYMSYIPGGVDLTVTDPNIPYWDMTSLGAMTNSKLINFIADASAANIVILETIDPYEGFGNTEEDAGEVNPDPQDDDIEIDDLPDRSFASAGFCRIYNPDVSDLNDLASYMWTDQTFLQTVINHLKQLLENPMDAIISLSLVPVQPPTTASKVPVSVMYVPTGVSMRQVTQQFVSVDCGSTVLQESLGGAMDYNPYTRVQIYLPYIGTVQLDTDEVMAKTIHVVYHIDVVTGVCCAEIEADNKLLYQFTGHCSVSQPITSADFSSYLNAAIAAAKVAVGVATGTAATTAAAAASQGPSVPSSSPTGNSSQALAPVASGQAIGPHLGSPPSRHQQSFTDFSYLAGDSKSVQWGEVTKPGNINTVASAMGGKMVVQHSGGFSGNSGYLAKRRPYLIVIRPRIANPEKYSQHFGRTSMEYLNLGRCTGYTKVESVHLTGLAATNPELSEISSLLKGGVIF